MALHKAEQAWADAGFTRDTVPPLTAAEATAAARKLWRHEYGVPIGGKPKRLPESKRKPGQPIVRSAPKKIVLTSGNRFNDWRDGVLYVNPDGGWWRLIHDLSHEIHRLVHPNLRPHHKQQEIIEARMVRYALSKGWLTGVLLPAIKPADEAPPKPTLQQKRAARAVSALARAEHRLKLAQDAVKRLTPKVRYYEKALAAPKPEPRVSMKQKVITLAAQIGAEIDLYPDSAKPSICWPPDWLAEEHDEWAGDHCVSEWSDCLPMLQAWAALSPA